MIDNNFTVDKLVQWLDEARDLEDSFREKMLFWKRVRMNLAKELALKTDQEQAVSDVERMLEDD